MLKKIVMFEHYPMCFKNAIFHFVSFCFYFTILFRYELVNCLLCCVHANSLGYCIHNLTQYHYATFIDSGLLFVFAYHSYGTFLIFTFFTLLFSLFALFSRKIQIGNTLVFGISCAMMFLSCFHNEATVCYI